MTQVNNYPRAVLRAGLYERVSTEEQALRGFSIDAQKDNLEEYCKKNNIKIVRHYTDEGISGAKPPLKRPALQQLLEDVQDGKIDIILFTKLDRWFRSVQEYFKVQEILDKHKVEWKTIHEDYDTTTANGRMAITIFLAIAQNEREKTSERISVVFEHKRKNKEACIGGPKVTMGYMKREIDGVKRLVKNPEEEQRTNEFWELVLKYNNINKAGKYMNDTYGYSYTRNTWSKLVRREVYCGSYKGVENFCEPYITREQWESIVKHPERNIKKTQNNRVYLFTGLMKCPICGANLSSTYKPGRREGLEYYGYRCIKNKSNACDYQHVLSERKIESFLLNNMDRLLQQEIEEIEKRKRQPKPKPKTNIAALKEKVRRLNVTYMAGGKSDKEYLAEMAELNAAIAKAQDDTPPPQQDEEKYRQLLASDIKGRYENMDREDKQRFWRTLLTEIIIEGNKIREPKFF